MWASGILFLDGKNVIFLAFLQPDQTIDKMKDTYFHSQIEKKIFRFEYKKVRYALV